MLNLDFSNFLVPYWVSYYVGKLSGGGPVMVIICMDQGHIIIYGAAVLCATNLYNLTSAMPCPAILDYQIQYCDH